MILRDTDDGDQFDFRRCQQGLCSGQRALDITMGVAPRLSTTRNFDSTRSTYNPTVKVRQALAFSFGVVHERLIDGKNITLLLQPPWAYFVRAVRDRSGR